MLDALALMVVFSLCLGGVLTGIAYVVNRLISQQLKLVQDTIQQVADTVRITATSATEAVLQATMAATIGEKGKAVPQPEDTPENNPMHPSWMTWESEHEDPEKWGVGDSVNLGERPQGDRAAMLRDDEPILPWLAPPDMTGENFNEGELGVS